MFQKFQKIPKRGLPKKKQKPIFEKKIFFQTSQIFQISI